MPELEYRIWYSTVSPENAAVASKYAFCASDTRRTPLVSDDAGCGNGLVVFGPEAVQMPEPPPSITASVLFVHVVTSVRNGHVGVSVSELVVDAPLTEPF